MPAKDNHSNSDSIDTRHERQITIQRQAMFGADGKLEFDSSPVETTLPDHGVDVDTRERRSRIEIPSSEDFVDDRPVARSTESSCESGSTAGKQETLFADTDADQRTLDGENATTLFRFDN